MAPSSPTVGIIYPGHAAEEDYPQLEARLRSAEAAPVELPVVISTIGVDEHTAEALLETGSHPRLREACQRLMAQHRVDSVMWACTSGSFVYGWEGAHQQVRQLEAEAGVPTSSTSLAFVHALQALGAHRVAVAASYPSELADHFADFLASAGVEVVSFAAHDIFTAGLVGLMGRAEVLAMVRAADAADAEAILVPDTAMRSLRWLPELEAAVGKPVLTANQVTVWEGMRIAGVSTPRLPELGTLFDPPAEARL